MCPCTRAWVLFGAITGLFLLRFVLMRDILRFIVNPQESSPLINSTPFVAQSHELLGGVMPFWWVRVITIFSEMPRHVVKSSVVKPV